MAVFRVEKNKNYTVMCNHHLKDKSLTLKSKGLLSVILSLPDEGNYTTRGLAAICKEGVDCIGASLRELETAGYLERNQLRDDRGRITDTEYVIYEFPQDKPPKDPNTGKPDSPLPHTASPHTENPYMDEPDTEMTAQLNTNINKFQNVLNPDGSSTDSIPSLSTPPPRGTERKGTEAVNTNDFEIYRDIIRENLEYDHMMANHKYDRDRIDEIVDLMLETVCTAKQTVRISSDDFPAALVKAKFLKLNSTHLEFVLDCLKKNTTDIRNIKKYLLAMLFNAPSTIDSYYTALVAHDMANR
jgi:hypothetical protein